MLNIPLISSAAFAIALPSFLSAYTDDFSTPTAGRYFITEFSWGNSSTSEFIRRASVNESQALRYDTDEQAANSANNEIYVNIERVLPYDSNWTASLDVTLPDVYTQSIEDDNTDNFGDEFVEISLGIQYENTSGDERILLGGLSLTEDSFNGRNFLGETFLNENLEPNGHIDFESSTDETVNVLISYDQASQLITTSFSGTDFTYTDSVSDWGMTSGDVFRVGIVGANGNEVITRGDPLVADNLVLTGSIAAAVPEASHFALFAALSGLASVLIRRRNFRKY